MTAPAKVVHARRATGGSDNWCTPTPVLDRVRRIGPIGIDPCTEADNPTGARLFKTKLAFEGDDWVEQLEPGELAYVNPPYSVMESTQARPGWAAFIPYQAAEGCEVVSLVAARPDTRWFDYLVWQTAQAVCFWKGRLRFVGAPSSAPFPSCLVYHGPRTWRFEEAFHDAGKVVRLR
jgi:DNA N-6-adenine-methyltransferase (Dam)